VNEAGLQALVEPVVTGLGYDFVGLERGGGRGQEIVRIYIDLPGGITVDDCETVSRQIGAVLDVEDAVRGHYTLEVSSPGIDRPLFTPAQYEQFVGSEISVRLRQPLRERRRLQGRLLSAGAAGFELDAAGEHWSVPYLSVERARLVPQWPAPGTGRARPRR
jgi:ribosome maturation factor RimP